jgi:hypothetical protein
MDAKTLHLPQLLSLQALMASSPELAASKIIKMFMSFQKAPSSLMIQRATQKER